jgi:protein involved in polysaccharide export with SLBB domain
MNRFLLATALLGSVISADIKAADPVPPDTTQLRTKPAEYEVQAGDQLDIRFFYNQELNEVCVVRPDGKIALQLIGEIEVQGLSPQQVTALLTEKYTSQLAHPDVTVMVKSFTKQRVFVDGEVGRPGLIELNGPMTVMEAVASAGGLKDTAKATEIIVIRRARPDQPPVILKTNLKQLLAGEQKGEDHLLSPFDVVFVPRSPIANVNRWVDQYLRKNIPVTAGFLTNSF